MKKLIFLFSLFIAFQAVAQEGIRFRHCSWEEAKAMAKKEKKPKSGFMQCAAAISSASMMSFLPAEMKSLS